MWTYLANTKCQSSISTLIPNQIAFEHIEIDDKTKLSNFTNGYIELMNEGFFDSFTNNYNMLFVSKYDPTQNPIEKAKLFEMKI